MRDNKPYNGWTNYATWRVKLEIFDGTEFVKEDFAPEEEKLTIADLANNLKNVAEQAVTEDNTNQSLAASYALAFLDDVNYYEIAESMAKDDPELLS